MAPWDDTSDVATKGNLLFAHLKEAKHTTSYYQVLSLTLTPQEDEVKKDLLKRFLMPWKKNNSVYHMSSTVHELWPLISRDYKEDLHHVNAIMMNFPTNVLIKDIVEHNYHR